MGYSIFQLRKQKVILLNLSAVEITTIVHSMIHLAASYLPMSSDHLSRANHVFVTSYHVITSLFYCSMILIAVERLICILSPTKHYVHIRRSTLKKVGLMSDSDSLDDLITIEKFCLSRIFRLNKMPTDILVVGSKFLFVYSY